MLQLARRLSCICLDQNFLKALHVLRLTVFPTILEKDLKSKYNLKFCKSSEKMTTNSPGRQKQLLP